jgi:hypothetical protein
MFFRHSAAARTIVVGVTPGSTKRGALAAAAILAVTAAMSACGSGGGKGAAAGAGGADAGGAAGSAGGGAAGTAAPVDGGAGADAKADLATDFGAPQPDVPVHCPTAAGALAPADAPLVIDDFDGTGKLDGRIRSTDAFAVREQFDATANATFAPAPAIETSCGAAAPGAAHIRGRAADTGATFAIIFSSPAPGGGTPLDHDDASATRGFSFRVALGDPAASKLVSLQVNLAGSKWDYTKDVPIDGTTWQTVTVLWTDLESAPGAPAFSPAALNQIVFPFFPDTDVDLYIDDVAFVK